MIEMSPLARLLTDVFLVSVMLSIGLEVTGRTVVDTLRNTGLMSRALVANLVLVPALGLLLVRLFALPPDIAAGVLILAAAPGAPFALSFTSKVKDALAFAAALTFVLTLLSFVVSPTLAGVLLGGGGALGLPVGRVAVQATLLLVVPMLVGFVLQRWTAGLAEALRRPVALCAALSFPAVIIMTLGLKSAATRAIGGRNLLALLLLVLGGMLIGWLMGGPERGTRRVLATGTGMRNAMVALLIARTSFPDSKVDVVVLAFSALMVPPNLVFTVYQNVRARRRAAAPMPAARASR
jgi:BASS family bile acid:Na+ symporter